MYRIRYRPYLDNLNAGDTQEPYLSSLRTELGILSADKPPSPNIDVGLGLRGIHTCTLPKTSPSIMAGCVSFGKDTLHRDH
ncbi:hypothetical protein J6590_048373 [Homalodisca vitripennis]|nr:hypothetical protein J6590_048373 [Homalodisca vitripennis]